MADDHLSQARRGMPLAAADWLCLGAAPTFAIMAMLTAVFDAGQPTLICSGMVSAAPMNGMTLMYGLMSAFHLRPWIEILSPRHGDAG